MPDINLLRDTESAEEKKRKKRSFPTFDMTKSQAKKIQEENIKPKSSPYGHEFSERQDEVDQDKPLAKNFNQKDELEDIFASERENDKQKKAAPVEYTEAKTEKIKKEELKPKSSFFGRLFSRRKKEKNEEEAKILKSDSGDKKLESLLSSPGGKKEVGAGKMVYSQPPKEGKKEVKEIKEPQKKKSRMEEMPVDEDSFLVNLLPEELVGREEPKKKLLTLGLVALGAIFVVLIAYFGLAFYQSNIVSKTQAVRQERIDLDTEINSLKEEYEASIVYKQKIDSVRGIVSQHIHWSKFFEKLEQYTIKDVYYSGAFSGMLNSSINLDAMTKDFSSVAEQLIVFQNANDFVKKVTIIGAQKKSGSTGSETAMPGEIQEELVNFSVSLELIPEIFYYTLEEEYEIEEITNTNINSGILINTNANINLNTNTNASLTNANLNSNVSTNSNLNLNLNSDFNFNTNSSS